MVSDSERTKILEMIEDGTISAEDGLSLLNALDASLTTDNDGFSDITEEGKSVLLKNTSPALIEESDLPIVSGDLKDHENVRVESDYYPLTDEDVSNRPAPPNSDEIKRWKRWWIIPLWIGAGITVLGGLLMFWAYQANGFGFWFACSWFPFLLGVATLSFAWNSRISPWLHVRIQQASGERPQKIAISFPIPIRLTVWGLRLFGHYIPHMDGVSLEEVILALKDVARDGTPFFVDVDDEDGERVQVFIG
jgi:hypothetical protein